MPVDPHQFPLFFHDLSFLSIVPEYKKQWIKFWYTQPFIAASDRFSKEFVCTDLSIELNKVRA